MMRRAFTLIELLIVIAIIAMLAAVVILAINPTKQLGDARNAERRTDVTTILNAVYQYAIDENNMPAGIPLATPKVICQDSVDPSTCASVLNGVSLRMLSGAYLTTVPSDPQLLSSGTGTRYTIVRTADNRITVAAPGAERAAEISVTR